MQSFSLSSASNCSRRLAQITWNARQSSQPGDLNIDDEKQEGKADEEEGDEEEDEGEKDAEEENEVEDDEEE